MCFSIHIAIAVSCLKSWKNTKKMSSLAINFPCENNLSVKDLTRVFFDKVGLLIPNCLV